MGIANLQWYEERNLLQKKTITVQEHSLLAKGGKYKAGDTFEVYDPIQSYSCGRIDVRGGDTGPYGDEIAVPPMKSESWNSFGGWLYTFETDEMWSLKDLVWMYEKTNPKIEWDECPEWYSETYDPSKGVE
jgi:hypothetical protein